MFSIPKFKNPLSIFRSSSSTINIIEPGKNIIAEKNIMEDGSDIKWEDTVEFTFPVKGGRVIKVYDADTITIASRLPYEESPMYRLSVRLNGIDTPEMKGKGVSDEEKEASKVARDFVANLVLNKFVRLENITSEKYGRILADVYVGDIHLNELLLKQRYAVKYDGGTKVKPTSWLKYRVTNEV
jgi:endonuclease YncB( thermonuclease family)